MKSAIPLETPVALLYIFTSEIHAVSIIEHTIVFDIKVDMQIFVDFSQSMASISQKMTVTISEKKKNIYFTLIYSL